LILASEGNAIVDGTAGRIGALGANALLMAVLLLFTSMDVRGASLDNTIGVVKNARGNLVIIRGTGTQDRIKGSAILPLFEGDELRSEAGCQAAIEFHDGTRIALNEKTTFIVRSRPAKVGIVRIIRMLLGEVWVKTSEKPDPLEFETPAAKAAVRGTELNVRVADDGRSQLTVLEGTVDFWSAGVNCSIQRSTQSIGQHGQPCTPPVPVDPNLVTGWSRQLLKLVRTVATIRAGGSGARPQRASSAAQARLLAERAAKADAYRNLLEAAYGVLVTSSTSVKDLSTRNDNVRTTLNGFIRGARLVEVRHLDDGSVEVEMEIRLNREFWAIFPRV
jgi:hypothetical protein